MWGDGDTAIYSFMLSLFPSSYLSFTHFSPLAVSLYFPHAFHSNFLISPLHTHSLSISFLSSLISTHFLSLILPFPIFLLHFFFSSPPYPFPSLTTPYLHLYNLLLYLFPFPSFFPVTSFPSPISLCPPPSVPQLPARNPTPIPHPPQHPGGGKPKMGNTHPSSACWGQGVMGWRR